MPKAWLITNKGFSLVEVILASAVFGLLVTALVGAYLYGAEATALAGNRARANLLAEEGLEAIRNIHDGGFNDLATGTHGLAISANQWTLSGTQDTSDIFTRQIDIANIDSTRKTITSTVTWQQNPQRTGSVSLVSRLTNWIASGIGNWAIPIQEASLDLSGNNNGVKVQILGNYTYVVRDGGTDFVVVDVSNPASPSVVGLLTLAGNLSNLFVSGNYAYVASSDNSAELIIVDISIPSSPSVVGTFNNPSNNNANGVFVVSTTAYLAISGNDEFSIVNVATPTAPSLISTLSLSGDANELVISGDYAYITSDDNGEELQVIDISNPLLPSQVASLNLSSNTNADTVSIAGSTLFIGQGSTLYTVDVAIPTSPTQLGFIGTSGTVNDIALNLGNGNLYVFIATSDNSLEFQIIDVSVPASPVLLGSVNTSGNDNLNGIAYGSTLDRAVGVGDRNTEEVFIFAPQ